MNWEFAVLDFVRANLQTAWGDVLWPAISALGNAGVIWIVLALVLLCVKKTRKLGLCVAIALVLDVISCNLILKPLVDRARPFDLRQVELLIEAPHDASFPSGHTAASFAAASALLFGKCRKIGIPALILAGMIAFSRLYLYVHFPTDILAGMVLGTACGFAGVRFCARSQNK